MGPGQGTFVAPILGGAWMEPGQSTVVAPIMGGAWMEWRHEVFGDHDCVPFKHHNGKNSARWHLSSTSTERIQLDSTFQAPIS